MYEAIALSIGSITLLMIIFAIVMAILMIAVMIFKNDTVTFSMFVVVFALGMGGVLPIGVTIGPMLFENKSIEVTFETDIRTIVMTEYWARSRESTYDEWGEWSFGSYYVESVSGPEQTYKERRNEVNKE